MNQVTWDKPFRYYVLTLILIVTAVAFWFIRDLFQPLVTAALISVLFSPLVQLITQKTRLKRRHAANLVFFVVMLLLVALLVAVIPGMLREIQPILQDINNSLDAYQKNLEAPVILFNIPIYLNTLIPSIRSTLRTVIVADAGQTLQLLQTTSRGFLWFLVVTVSTYHLMTEWETLRERIFLIAPEAYQKDMRRLYMEIRAIWWSYMRGQVRLMFILAVLYTTGWSVIGLRGALWIGLLAGILNLVPEVGPGISAAFAIIVAWLEGSPFLHISNGWFAILTMFIYLLINNFKNIYLQPRILGKSVFLHEGVVFVALIAALMTQGVLGVLVVVPTLASLMVLGRYTRHRLLGLEPFEDSSAQ